MLKMKKLVATAPRVAELKVMKTDLLRQMKQRLRLNLQHQSTVLNWQISEM